MAVVAKLSAVADPIGFMELHPEPQVHVPVRQQCSFGHVQGVPFLPRFYASDDAFRQLPHLFPALERLSCHRPEYGPESDYRILLRQVCRIYGCTGKEGINHLIMNKAPRFSEGLFL